MLYGFSDGHVLYDAGCGLAGSAYSAIYLLQECAMQPADAVKQTCQAKQHQAAFCLNLQYSLPGGTSRKFPGEKHPSAKAPNMTQHNRALQAMYNARRQANMARSRSRLMMSQQQRTKDSHTDQHGCSRCACQYSG